MLFLINMIKLAYNKLPVMIHLSGKTGELILRWDLLFILIFLPWLATYAGAVLALIMKLGSIKKQGMMLGFAAGVMIAASIWSLVLPAFEETNKDTFGAFIVTLGFFLGCLGMLGLDKLIPHQHSDDNLPEGLPSSLPRPMLLVLAVALHNIPEGLALGVVVSAAMKDTALSWNAALIFSLGLVLQNFPEGMAVVYPLYQSGVDRKRCHRLGLLASFTEPVAALIGAASSVLLIMLGGIILPLLLSTAAGAMIFIVVEELIPQARMDNKHFGTYGFLLGFWAMALMGMMGT